MAESANSRQRFTEVRFPRIAGGQEGRPVRIRHGPAAVSADESPGPLRRRETPLNGAPCSQTVREGPGEGFRAGLTMKRIGRRLRKPTRKSEDLPNILRTPGTAHGFN